MGVAAGFMREAKLELHALKKVSKSTLSITHSTVASKATKEEEVVTELFHSFTRINDTVRFKPGMRQCKLIDMTDYFSFA
jgi:hypothetical protein